MKKLFSFLCIVILFSCSKDVEEPVIFTLLTEGNSIPTNGTIIDVLSLMLKSLKGR